MKQCPKCSSTYANDKQKFCTKDGTPLVDAHQASAGQDATIRIDSTQLDDEITKVISQPLPRMTGSAFDPYKTQVSTQQESAAPPPAPSQPIAPAPVAAPPPAPTPSVSTPAPSGPIAPPPPSKLAQTISAPAPATSVPPPPSQPIAPPPEAAPPPPVPPPTTANIGSAQPTNASIPANTVPAVTVSPSTRMAATIAASAPPVQPAKKRSKLPLILGILFVLFVLVVGVAVAGYFLFPVIKPMLTKRSVHVEPQVEPRRPEPSPVVVSTPDIGNTKPETPKIEVPPYSPPANAVQFVNSNAKLDGKLADHYVDFSFYYPKTWQKDPKAGVAGASNFAKVERRLPPDFTQENFAVGWYSSTGSEEGDRVIFPTLAENLSKQFAAAKSFSEYHKVSEGPTKAGVYDGYEFRFESVSRNTEHGDIKIWGRVIFVPPTDGSNNGVTLLMLTTSLATELRSVDDVGVKGELPMVLESFRFGK